MLYFDQPQKVYLQEEGHIYYDDLGNTYTSVSTVRKHFQQPFDALNISRAVAKSTGRDAQEIREEWRRNADDASGHGTIIHNSVQLYETKAIMPENPEIAELAKSLAAYFRNLYKFQYYEVTLGLTEQLIAGTFDRACIRGFKIRDGKKVPVVDLFDKKTNKSKGIQFISSYDKRMLDPFDHLEDCNYIDYTWQLSIYALMIELIFGYIIGRLGIISIPPNNLMDWKIIPVYYAKADAQRILSQYMIDKKLPTIQYGSNNIIHHQQKQPSIVAPRSGEALQGFEEIEF